MTDVVQPAPAQPDIATRTHQYVQVRDMIKAMKERHKKELSKLEFQLERLEGLLLQALNAAGAKHIATPFGTAYVSTKASATIADRGAFLDFLKSSNRWELADLRANAPAVTEFIKEAAEAISAAQAAGQPINGIVTQPPGVNFGTITGCNVRKS